MAKTKDAAFYRKQRQDDEAKAKKGDPKAKAELSKIEAKREKSRGTSTAKRGGGGDQYAKNEATNVAALGRLFGGSGKKSGTEQRAARLGSGGKSATMAGTKPSGTEQRAARMTAANSRSGGDTSALAQKPPKKKAAS